MTSIKEDYLSAWTVLDAVAVLVSFVLVILYSQVLSATSSTKEHFDSLVKSTVCSSECGESCRSDCEKLIVQFYAVAEDMFSRERGFRIVICLYPMVVMLRLFKSFSAQPRLAIVTSTLNGASQDLLHFGIVFFSVFCCMCVNSVLLFGQDHQEFATFDRAWHSCFLCMHGDWDFQEIQGIGRLNASIWFVVFVLVIILILLNITLAIIMDAYNIVKEHTGNAQALPRQISEMVRRRRQYVRGDRVRLNDIWNAFFAEVGDKHELLTSEHVVTPKELLAKVPGLQTSQGKRTMENALSAYRRKQHESFDDENVKEALQEIDELAKKLDINVRSIKGAIQHYDEMDLTGKLTVSHMGEEQALTEGMCSTILGTVGGLRDEVGDVLASEMEILGTSQDELQQRQADTLRCIRETHATMCRLRETSDEVSAILEQQVIQKRNAYSQKRKNRAASRSALTSCDKVFGPTDPAAASLAAS